MAKYKTTDHTATVLAAIEDGLSDIEMLADEMEEWRDNMEGTGLENTQKFETVSEAADSLRNGIDNKPDIPDELREIMESLTISYRTMSPYGKKSPSRSLRLSNAVVMIEVAIEKLVDHIEQMEESDRKTDLQDYVTELESAKDEAEMVDFPGMF